MTDEGETPPEKKVSKYEHSQDLVYHYSREHRLERASPAVRSFNDGNITRPGLIKALLGSRGNVLLFVTIVVFVVFGFANRYIDRVMGIKLGGNTITVTIVKEEGISILEMTKTLPKSGEAYIGEVDIAISPIISNPAEGELSPVFSHRFFFRPVESEKFTVSLPFEENDFIVLIITEAEQKSMRIRVR